MSENRNDLDSLRDRARLMYVNGASRAEIAKELDIKPQTFSGWCYRGRWSEDRIRNGYVPGTQAGTQRTLGKHWTGKALHGAFRKGEDLSEEELKVLADLPTDEEELIMQQIRINEVLLCRYLNAERVLLDMARENPESRVMVSERNKVCIYEPVLNRFLSIQGLITRIQGNLTKSIMGLHEIRMNRSQLEMYREEHEHFGRLQDLQKELMDARIEYLDAKTEKLIGTGEELEDLSQSEKIIYGNKEN